MVVIHGPSDPWVGSGRAADRKIARFWLYLPTGLSCPPSISAVVRDGGRSQEVVFHDDFQCGERVFSIDGDCLLVARLILAFGHAGSSLEGHSRLSAATIP